MQLEQFYDIATKVSSRKSATTLGDLPDWLLSCFKNYSGHRLSAVRYQVIIFKNYDNS